MSLIHQPTKHQRFTRNWKTVVMFIIGVYSFNSSAQTPKISSKKAYTKVANYKNDEVQPYTEEFATFPGGSEAFEKFLTKNLRYKKKNAESKVYASFTITKTGALTNIKIDKGTNAVNNNEVIRVLKLSPKWQPAKINGKPLDTRFTIPVNFTKF